MNGNGPICGDMEGEPDRCDCEAGDGDLLVKGDNGTALSLTTFEVCGCGGRVSALLFLAGLFAAFSFL